MDIKMPGHVMPAGLALPPTTVAADATGIFPLGYSA